jgi:hypothetical protein
LPDTAPQPGVGSVLAELGCPPSQAQPVPSEGPANLAGTDFLTLAQAVFRFDQATVDLKRSLVEVSAAQDAMKDDLDSVSDLSEEVLLKLQLIVDRQMKVLSILSNIMKKITDTEDTIVQNLK